MCPLQSKSGPSNIGEAFIKDRDIGTDDKDAKILIRKANSVDILSIFREHSIKLDEDLTKCFCPFPFHNERTASFKYYKDTNSFYCFGCKSGGGPVEFVALIGNISKDKAATKILTRFDIDATQEIAADYTDFVSRQQLFLEFSTLIRNFISDNLDDKSAMDYCEKVTLIFDTINFKHNLDNGGLKSLITKLKTKLDQYKCQ
jgi:DNA primase